jgi:hypothetical protein
VFVDGVAIARTGRCVPGDRASLALPRWDEKVTITDGALGGIWLTFILVGMDHRGDDVSCGEVTGEHDDFLR